MTKIVKRLNEDDPEADPDTSQDEKAVESEGCDGIEDGCAMLVTFTTCTVLFTPSNSLLETA